MKKFFVAALSSMVLFSQLTSVAFAEETLVVSENQVIEVQEDIGEEKVNSSKTTEVVQKQEKVTTKQENNQEEKIVSEDVSVKEIDITVKDMNVHFHVALNGNIDNLESITLYFKGKSSGIEYEQYAEKLADGTFAGQFQIEKYTTPSDTYEVTEISLDTYDEVIYIQEPSNDYTFEITNTLFDNEAPIIESISINKQVGKLGEELIFTAKASDNVSGIEEFLLQYQINDDEDNNKSVYLKYDKKSGNYVGRLKVTQYLPTGTWKLVSVYVTDNAGNEDSLNVGEFNGKLDFSIKGTTPDVTAPIFHEITADKTKVKAGEKVKLTLKVSDDLSGIKDIHVGLIYELKNDEVSMGIPCPDFTFNKFTGNYELELNLSEYVDEGKYYVNSIYITDNAGNPAYYTDGGDIGYSLGENDQKDRLINPEYLIKPIFLFEVEAIHDKVDYEVPEIRDVTVSKNKVALGSSYKVIVDAVDELSKITSVKVFLESDEEIKAVYNEKTKKYEATIEVSGNQYEIGDEIKVSDIEVMDSAFHLTYLSEWKNSNKWEEMIAKTTVIVSEKEEAKVEKDQISSLVVKAIKSGAKTKVLPHPEQGKVIVRVYYKDGVPFRSSELLYIDYVVNGTIEEITALVEDAKEIAEKELEEENKGDVEAATKVIEAIKMLPTELTLANKDAVKAARTAYDALTVNQKKLVTNYNKLTEAEAKIAELETNLNPDNENNGGTTPPTNNGNNGTTTPVPPTEDGKQEETVTPDKNEESSTEKEETQTDSDNPETGDKTNIALLLTMFLLSVASMFILKKRMN